MSPPTSKPIKIILLIESLDHWVQALDPATRWPMLERTLGRARRLPAISADMDRCRFHCAGLSHTMALPTASIRRLGDLADDQVEAARNDHRYWLAADPVTLKAGLKSLLLIPDGIGRLNDEVAWALAEATAEALAEEGLELEALRTGRWYVALETSPGFDFVPPHEVTGADLAEVLPDQPGAARWRRIANNIQMTLHAHPANERLRAAGQAEINSVWFWGGGQLPAATQQTDIRRSYSSDPVMQGLSRLQGIECHDGGNWIEALARSDVAGSSLFDVQTQIGDVGREMHRIEALLAVILPRLGRDVARLEIHSPSSCWQLTGPRLKQFWKRDRPLGENFHERPGAAP